MGNPFYLWNCIDKGELWLKEDEKDPRSWSVAEKADIEEMIGRKLRSNELDRGREIVGRDDYVWVRTRLSSDLATEEA
ncbi:MAG: hypothetical protein KAW89_10230 [Armatimonadetes bacterium]|nr:hypothetical protein [Armatimonadota bacterium]